MPETIEIDLSGNEGEQPGTGEQEPTTPPEGAPEAGEQEPADGDTFPREYVEKLRREAAEHRTRAGRADELAAALWGARVAALGALADPTDLPMPDGADPLDADGVQAAVDELLTRKPHLAARTPRGDVGQSVGVEQPGGGGLGSLLRSLA